MHIFVLHILNMTQNYVEVLVNGFLYQVLVDSNLVLGVHGLYEVRGAKEES
jgi:hypothetical protein